MAVLNPRTHPRGAAPVFTLPKKNPNPERMTDALWWLVCMREALEPDLSENGGTYANKPGYHNVGNNLPDHGAGNSRTDHSIRRSPDRQGDWWKTKTSAHDWTFRDAQNGDYKTINKYTKRLIAAMRDPDDLRPDDVYAYTLGQTDGDLVIEGYNEYTDDAETSADKTHVWHRHDSFRRNIIGSFAAMWKALTIDMGWTYEEWKRSVSASPTTAEEDLPMKQADFTALFLGALKDKTVRAEVGRAVLESKINDAANPTRTSGDVARDFAKLRGVLVGDAKDTANAKLLNGSPLQLLLTVPNRLSAVEDAVKKLTSGSAG
jgi:hypothetical protein